MIRFSDPSVLSISDKSVWLGHGVRFFLREVEREMDHYETIYIADHLFDYGEEKQILGELLEVANAKGWHMDTELHQDGTILTKHENLLQR